MHMSTKRLAAALLVAGLAATTACSDDDDTPTPGSLGTNTVANVPGSLTDTVPAMNTTPGSLTP